MKYICTCCSVYKYDEDRGDFTTNLEPCTKIEDIPDIWRCPVCKMTKTHLQQINEDTLSIKRTDYNENQGQIKDLNYYQGKSNKILKGVYGVYPDIDGRSKQIYVGEKFGASIGIGNIGQGQTFEANYNSLQQYQLKMRVIKDHHEPEMSISIFGKEITAPIMGASLSGVKPSLNDAVPEELFYWSLLRGAESFGSIGMVGNTSTSPDDLGVNIVGKNSGWGIPIFKPQSQDRLIKLIKLAEKQDVIAVGVDLDGAGSTFWAASGKPVYRKSENELQELVDCTGKPLIFKGIMSTEDAAKIVDSGASACYVSNHGGRVMDGGQGVAEVLPYIAREVSGKILILADGSVRTGFDVLKVISLGADIALIGRPLAQMAISGGEAAVKMYLDYVKDDFRRAMILTGCDTLKDANMDILAQKEHI